MEKVWGELKKIEHQAEKIRLEAQMDALSITKLAKKKSEELVANAKTYAQEDSQKLYDDLIQRANKLYEEKIRIGEKNGDKLREAAIHRLDQTVSIIIKSVIGDSSVAGNKVR
jgi:vacuolar-type H+-ATPase subunit H